MTVVSATRGPLEASVTKVLMAAWSAMVLKTLSTEALIKQAKVKPRFRWSAILLRPLWIQRIRGRSGVPA